MTAAAFIATALALVATTRAVCAWVDRGKGGGR